MLTFKFGLRAAEETYCWSFSSNFFHPCVNLRQHTERVVSMFLLSRFKSKIISQSHIRYMKNVLPLNVFTGKFGCITAWARLKAG